MWANGEGGRERLNLELDRPAPHVPSPCMRSQKCVVCKGTTSLLCNCCGKPLCRKPACAPVHNEECLGRISGQPAAEPWSEHDRDIFEQFLARAPFVEDTGSRTRCNGCNTLSIAYLK